MSVSNVVGVSRIVLPATANRSQEPAAPREPESNALVQLDDTTKQPIPPRYPWLSRLARELEPASRQPSPYGSVELLGEQLDKQA